MDSSDDDNPYDFVKKYRKLLMDNGKKKLVTKLNKQFDDNEKSNEVDIIDLDDDSPPVEIISITTTATTSQPSVSKQCTHQRRSSKRKRKEVQCATINESVICIGDFDEDYKNTVLKLPFSAPKIDNDDDIMTNWLKKNAQDDKDAELISEVNRVMNIKVFWCKTQTHRFPLRMFQPIKSIYEYFAKLENIQISHVYLKLNNKLLSPSDTPNSINYKITDFIDGEIVFYKSPYDVSNITEVKELSDDEVKFRIIQSDVKIPMFISMKKTDKLQIIYVKLSETLGLDLDLFSLEFDGDKIKNSDTMESLGLEGDECFELKKQLVL